MDQPRRPGAEPGPDGPTIGDGDERIDRFGVLLGVSAYLLWGIFPLYFHALEPASAIEILCHRIVWSFVVLAIALLVRRDLCWVAPLLRNGRLVALLAVAAVCISTNWLVYIWAVEDGRVVEGALGYFITPLVTVMLGVFVLGERLRRMQWLAVVCGAVAVVVITIGYGRLPWVSLVLAASFSSYGFIKKQVTINAVHSLTVETAVLLPAAAVVLVVLVANGSSEFVHGGVRPTLLLATAGLITATPLVLFGAAAQRIPLTMVGLLQYLTPVMQFIIGVFVLEEDMPPERWAGFAVIWLGLFLLSIDAVQSSGLRSRSNQPAEAERAGPGSPASVPTPTSTSGDPGF